MGFISKWRTRREERRIKKQKQKYGTEFGYYEEGKPKTFVPAYKPSGTRTPTPTPTPSKPSPTQKSSKKPSPTQKISPKPSPTSKGTYDLETGTYTSPTGEKFSMAEKHVPKETTRGFKKYDWAKPSSVVSREGEKIITTTYDYGEVPEDSFAKSMLGIVPQRELPVKEGPFEFRVSSKRIDEGSLKGEMLLKPSEVPRAEAGALYYTTTREEPGFIGRRKEELEISQQIISEKIPTIEC